MTAEGCRNGALSFRWSFPSFPCNFDGMEIKEVTTSQLSLGEDWHSPISLDVSFPDGFSPFVMGKSIEKLPAFVSKDAAHLIASVPIFWCEPERERTMDLVWSRQKNSVKFKVTEGARTGYVGFLVLIPS